MKDLGVLGGPPLRGAETVVRVTLDVMSCESAALLIYDDEAGALFVRAAAGWTAERSGLPISGSVASLVREESRPITFADTEVEMPEAMEWKLLGARALISVPVYGPDTCPVGVLAVHEGVRRDWTSEDIRRIEDLAYLTSQEIILKASFETLRILSRVGGQRLEPKH